MKFSQFREILSEDRRVNAGNSKGRLIVSAYRWAAFFNANRGRNMLWKFTAALVVFAYKIAIDYVMGVYIPVEMQVGRGLRIYHGVGIVLHPAAVLGDFCTLRQGVTVGSKDGTDTTVPVIGSHVDIGACALIIGAIGIGDGAMVGAGTVVLRDVPAGGVIVGPAGVIREAASISPGKAEDFLM